MPEDYGRVEKVLETGGGVWVGVVLWVLFDLYLVTAGRAEIFEFVNDINTLNVTATGVRVLNRDSGLCRSCDRYLLTVPGRAASEPPTRRRSLVCSAPS